MVEGRLTEEHYETTDKIAAALAEAQKDIERPKRNREVAVKTKSGGTYKFKYATLDNIIEAVREPLTQNGLWFTQTLEDNDGKYCLVTTLWHLSGQSIASRTPLLVEGTSNQQFGSALTYMRRYALTALLGVAADEDDDANAADGNTVTSSKDQGEVEQLVQWSAFGLTKTGARQEWRAVMEEIDKAKSEQDIDALLLDHSNLVEAIQQCSDTWPQCQKNVDNKKEQLSYTADHE